MSNKYETFWPRLGAAVIDMLIFFPFSFPELFWDMSYVRNVLIVEWLSLLLYTVYIVWGHGIYGYTIGKKLMQVKLVDLSENPGKIGIPRAFLRESIWIVISVASITGFTIRNSNADLVRIEEDPSFLVYDFAMFGWFLVEVITMLTNPKRRAVHDYIANTVVIRMPKHHLSNINQGED